MKSDRTVVRSGELIPDHGDAGPEAARHSLRLEPTDRKAEEYRRSLHQGQKRKELANGAGDSAEGSTSSISDAGIRRVRLETKVCVFVYYILSCVSV